jgi:hypothetical protein
MGRADRDGFVYLCVSVRNMPAEEGGALTLVFLIFELRGREVGVGFTSLMCVGLGICLYVYYDQCI